MSRPTRESLAGRAYLDLQNRARREGRGTQELLILYVVERWLARLGRSPYVNDFVLKGGMLLAAFGRRRPTADADALARNLSAHQSAVAARVAEIAAPPDSSDGVEFLAGTVSSSVIRDDALYAGVRVTMDARIATAAVKFRLDVNFGDPVTSEPQLIELLHCGRTRIRSGSSAIPSRPWWPRSSRRRYRSDQRAPESGTTPISTPWPGHIRFCTARPGRPCWRQPHSAV